MTTTTLGIIAGSGALPAQIVRTCAEAGRPTFVVSMLPENALQAEIKNSPHACLPIGAVGKAVAMLKERGVGELLFAGGLRRPKWSDVRPDADGAKLLARLIKMGRAGDNAALETVLAFFEEKGFVIVKAHDALKDAIAPEGAMTQRLPTTRDVQDMAYAMEAARALGRFDVGQAMAVEEGMILAVEGAEGTDAMMRRAGQYRRSDEGPILVKAKKTGQDERVDLPSVGVDTVLAAHAAGFRGVAVEAGAALIVDRAAMTKKADELGIFVWGIAIL
ncbi:MAG: UDP-2,3-diacylglucosamine diphosphatase LpxI [Rickettsiales bacterium]